MPRIPRGTNKMSANAVFKHRKLYKRLYGGRRNTIDFWYDKTLYGRIDRNGSAIYPSEAFLKQFSGTNCIYALNFVVDAYEDFIRRFVSLNKNNRAFMKEKYLSPQGMMVEKAWVSINALYHQTTENVYERFVRTHLNNKETNKRVTSYDSFIEVFIEYLDKVGSHSPFTRTGIITSLHCPPTISGLCVEFSSEDYSKDLKKHDGFFESPFFYSFIRAAEKHGFRIDVNAPWRLVADLNSPNIQRYMEVYDLTPENIFDRYYFKSYTFDVPALKVYLKQIYNSFVSGQPRIRTTKRTTIYRRQITDEEFNAYDDLYWLRVYAKIRRSEVLDRPSDEEYAKIIREATILQKSLDMNAAIRYINRQFLGQLVSTV